MRCSSPYTPTDGLTRWCELEEGHPGMHAYQPGDGMPVVLWPADDPLDDPDRGIPTHDPVLAARQARRERRRRQAPRRRELFLEAVVCAAVPCLMVSSFLFGRWTAETPTVVPAPEVYIVGPPSTSTSTSVAP